LNHGGHEGEEENFDRIYRMDMKRRIGQGENWGLMDPMDRMYIHGLSQTSRDNTYA